MLNASTVPRSAARIFILQFDAYVWFEDTRAIALVERGRRTSLEAILNLGKSRRSYSQDTKLKLCSIRHLCEDVLALALEHPLDC